MRDTLAAERCGMQLRGLRDCTDLATDNPGDQEFRGGLARRYALAMFPDRGRVLQRVIALLWVLVGRTGSPVPAGTPQRVVARIAPRSQSLLRSSQCEGYARGQRRRTRSLDNRHGSLAH